MMDVEKVIDLPESDKIRKIKIRVDKYGWLLFLVGLILIFLGINFLSMAFS